MPKSREEEFDDLICEGIARSLWVAAYMGFISAMQDDEEVSGVRQTPDFGPHDTWESAAPDSVKIRTESKRAAYDLVKGIFAINHEIRPSRGLYRLFATWVQSERGIPLGRPQDVQPAPDEARAEQATEADLAYAFGADLGDLALGRQEWDTYHRAPLSFSVPEMEVTYEGDVLTWWVTDIPRVVHQSNPPRWGASGVQTLLFDRRNYTPSSAKAWARRHGYKYGAVDTTDGYHRLRQFDPVRGTPCRTIRFGKGIKAVICAQPVRARRNPDDAGDYDDDCPVENPKATGPEILVVDNDGRSQRTTAAMLRKIFTGPRIIFADNVDAALANIAVHDVKLVVTEVSLLGAKTGLELCRTIQGMYPALADKIVFLTDYPVAGGYRHLPKRGATAPALRRVIWDPPRATQPTVAATTRIQPPRAPATAAPVSLRELADAVYSVMPDIHEARSADNRARERFGPDKVFISAIWRRLQNEPRFRGMTDQQFKRMLINANRDRLLNLARADLVGAMDPLEVDQSEILDRGSSFHFVLDDDEKSQLNLSNFVAIVNSELPYIQAEVGADDRAKGRFGDRKVFIAALWRMLRTHPRLHGMTEQQFKQRLFEAHRARLLTLARADLIGAMDLQEVRDSEYEQSPGVTYHFVVDQSSS